MGQVYPAFAPGSGTARFRSRAIPHFGQAPGLSDSTPGHMGHMYAAVDDLHGSMVCLVPATATMRLFVLWLGSFFLSGAAWEGSVCAGRNDSL